MKTSRILTMLALLLLMAPHGSALMAKWDLAIIDPDLDPYAQATTHCTENTAYAAAEAYGPNSEATAYTYRDTVAGQGSYERSGDRVRSTSSMQGYGTIHAGATASAGSEYAWSSCVTHPIKSDGDVLTGLISNPFVELPELGCEVRSGGPERSFEGVLARTAEGAWVLSGLLDGAPALMPAGTQTALTDPLVPQDVSLTSIAVAYSFTAEACGLVIGSP